MDGNNPRSVLLGLSAHCPNLTFKVRLWQKKEFWETSLGFRLQQFLQRHSLSSRLVPFHLAVSEAWSLPIALYNALNPSWAQKNVGNWLMDTHQEQNICGISSIAWSLLYPSPGPGPACLASSFSMVPCLPPLSSLSPFDDFILAICFTENSLFSCLLYPLS